MNVHFFGLALLVSLVICLPLIVASVIALILRKRPLSWILYGIGVGVSTLLLIGGNIFKGEFEVSELGKALVQNVGKFTSLKELYADAGYQGIIAQHPEAVLPIKLYYYSSWSMTIALVLFLVFVIAFLLVLIILMNKKRENYVRGQLTAQYQSISFK